MTVTLQRPYGFTPAAGDYLVLVDRLWPRGIRKEVLQPDEWNKDIAPSTELRKWFNHEPEKWNEFRQRYRRELQPHESELRRLAEVARHKHLVLLYAAKNTDCNNAVVLKELIEAAG